MTEQFDYQDKVWGTAIPTKAPSSLAGLRFFYFLRIVTNLSSKVLEIGCGAGGNLEGLKKYLPQAEFYGIDIGSRAIEFGRRRFPSLDLRVGSAEKVPFSDGEFDIVCFFDVLEHVDDPQKCIQEAVRVLKHGGIVHAYVPCEGELLSLHGVLNHFGINLKEKTAGHIQQLRKQDLLLFFKNSGLQVTEVMWSCHLLNQIGDIGYYLFLTLSGRKLEMSLEATLGSQSNTFSRRFLSLVKNVVSSIWYWESRLLWFFPGAGVHITAVKN